MIYKEYSLRPILSDTIDYVIFFIFNIFHYLLEKNYENLIF